MIKKSTELNLCQVNICSLSPNSALALSKYAYDNDLDIIAVQETKTANPPSICNFDVEHTNPQGAHDLKGGCALYISNKINNTCRLTHLETTTDLIWVLLDLGKTKIIVGNVYVQLNNIRHLQEVTKSCTDAQNYATSNHIEGVVLLGDFNSRSTLWNDDKTNTLGSHLSEFVNKSDYSILSPGSHTFSCKRSTTNGGSIIDLILASTHLTHNFTLCSVDKDESLHTGAPGNGHWPVRSNITFDTSIKREQFISIVMNFKETDWDEWANTLDNIIESDNISPEEEADPNLYWEKLLKWINTAKETIPKKKVCSHSKPYWNNELSVLSRQLRVRQAEYRRISTLSNKALYEEAKEVFNKAIADALNDWTEANTANLATKDKDKFWQTYAKNFKATTNSTNRIDILKDKSGELVYTDQDKCKLFYDTFFSGHHLDACDFDEPFKQEVDAEVNKLINNSELNQQSFHDTTDPDNSDLNADITLKEIQNAIRKMETSGKCLDGNGIHPLFIKKSGVIFLQKLKSLFNVCLENHTWPWKTSKVIILKKAGKTTYQDPSSYRPISLTSYVGKVLERVLESRLKTFLLKHNLIDDEQEGFMKHKSTTRYLYRLSAKLSQAKRKKLVGVLLLADFEKAFDSVWIQGLLYKLNKAGVKGNLWLTIANYLLDRFIQGKV